MSNEVAQRPTVTSVKPFKECKTIDEALRHPEMASRFAQAVPKHLSPERFIRTMAMAAYKTPLLREAPMTELVGAMLSLASLGLEANTPLGHAYLIPFEKKKWDAKKKESVSEGYTVQVVLGYKGVIELMMRSGMFVSVHGDVVYEGDEFSYEYGSNMHLRHVPKGSRENRKPLHAYAFVKLKDGYAFEVWPYEDVLKIRDGSQAYKAAVSTRDKWGVKAKGWSEAPWVKFERAMAIKTMIKQVGKYVPVSIELANAIMLDDASERAGMVFSNFVNDPKLLDDMSNGELQIESPDDNSEGEAPPETEKKPEPEKKVDKPKKAAAPQPAPQAQPEPEAPQEESHDDGSTEEALPEKASAEIKRVALTYDDSEAPQWMNWYKEMQAAASGLSPSELKSFVAANAETLEKFRENVPAWAAALDKSLGVAG